MTDENPKQFKIGSITIPADAEQAEAMLEESLIASTPPGVFVTSWGVGVDGYPQLHFLIGGFTQFVNGHPRRVRHSVPTATGMVLKGRACDMLAHWMVLAGNGPAGKPADAVHEMVKVSARRVVALLAKLPLECMRKESTVVITTATEPNETQFMIDVVDCNQYLKEL